MSTTTAPFTGGSAFASSLAQTVARAISFAALPMQQLQNQQNAIQNQQAEAIALTTNFHALQTALDSMNSAAGGNAYAAIVDAPTVAGTTVGAGVSAGTYSLNVLNTGSHTNTLSNTGLTVVTDPTVGNIDPSKTYTLTVDNTTFNISNTGSLNSLAQAINASGANVQATVVNVGGPSAPDYRLSVQGSKYAPSTIQLSNGTTPLLNTISAGTNVQYQVNGSPSTITSDSRAISLSTGLSVNLLATGAANITVAQSSSALQNSVTSFVAAYNSAKDELGKSRGQNGGALAGHSIVYELSNALQNIAGYSGATGNLSALSDVGITFDSNGHLQFDTSAFQQAASKSVSNVLAFFGTKSGSGFLQNTGNVLTGVNDPTSGTLTAFSGELSTGLTTLGDKIKSDQDHIKTLQASLTNQMARADAIISSMEQQLSYVTSLFTSMQQSNKPQ